MVFVNIPVELLKPQRSKFFTTPDEAVAVAHNLIDSGVVPNTVRIEVRPATDKESSNVKNAFPDGRLDLVLAFAAPMNINAPLTNNRAMLMSVPFVENAGELLELMQFQPMVPWKLSSNAATCTKPEELVGDIEKGYSVS